MESKKASTRREPPVFSHQKGMFITVLISIAIAMLLIMLLSTPSMSGLKSLPDHVWEAPILNNPPTVQTDINPMPIMTKAMQSQVRRNAAKVAASQVGISEIGGSSNHHPRIVMYRKAVTGPGENPWAREPWCADFVSWVWKKVGVPLGYNKDGSDYVPQLVSWAQLTGRWRTQGKKYRPVPGDLIVYTSEGMQYGHIGMVVANKNGKISTVEGNYQDRVSRRVINTGDTTVDGYIRPI